MSVNLSVALTSARGYLNDTPANVWTDAQLIPLLQEAHRELQTKLWVVGSPVVRAQSTIITVPSGTISLNDATLMPADMLTPFRLVEFAATTETAADATEMTEVTFIPLKAQGTILSYWSWMDEDIKFLGASADRKIIIFYRKEITIPKLTTDPIGILFGELYLGARGAAIAQGSLGNAAAATTLGTISDANFDLVVKSQRGQQNPSMRP